MEVRKLGQGGNLTEDREPFFELDGETYTLPKQIPSRITLQFLEVERENPAGSIQWLIDEVLGEDTYDALRGSDSVTGEELMWVFEQLGERVAGPLEKARGKSRNGSSRSGGS